MPATANIYVLATGGTFAMEPTLGGALAPMTMERLAGLLPAPESVAPGIHVTLDALEPLIDSSAITPADWGRIAERIGAAYPSHDGFVILHGTDTLAHTASALSFLFEHLAKPVIVTGAMVPLILPGSDAARNYRSALALAAPRVTGLPCASEVLVAFGDHVLRGCRTRKIGGPAQDAFASPNCLALGAIGERVTLFADRLRPAPAPDAAFAWQTQVDADVVDFTLFPGVGARHVTRALGHGDISGMVLRAYGSGNAPADPAFLAALDAAISVNSKIALVVSQCALGAVSPGKYAASLPLFTFGALSGGDMTPEAAFAKLAVTLGAHTGDEARKRLMVDLRGERSS